MSNLRDIFLYWFCDFFPRRKYIFFSCLTGVLSLSRYFSLPAYTQNYGVQRRRELRAWDRKARFLQAKTPILLSSIRTERLSWTTKWTQFFTNTTKRLTTGKSYAASFTRRFFAGVKSTRKTSKACDGRLGAKFTWRSNLFELLVLYLGDATTTLV